MVSAMVTCSWMSAILSLNSARLQIMTSSSSRSSTLAFCLRSSSSSSQILRTLAKKPRWQVLERVCSKRRMISGWLSLKLRACSRRRVKLRSSSSEQVTKWLKIWRKGSQSSSRRQLMVFLGRSRSLISCISARMRFLYWQSMRTYLQVGSSKSLRPWSLMLSCVLLLQLSQMRMNSSYMSCRISQSWIRFLMSLQTFWWIFPMLLDLMIVLRMLAYRTSSLISSRTFPAFSRQSCTSKLSFSRKFSKIFSSMLPSKTCSSHSRLTLYFMSSSSSSWFLELRQLCIMNSIFSILMMLSLISSHSWSSFRMSYPIAPEILFSKQSFSSSKILDFVSFVSSVLCIFSFRRFWQLLSSVTSSSLYLLTMSASCSCWRGKQLFSKQGSVDSSLASLSSPETCSMEMSPSWIIRQDSLIFFSSRDSISLRLELAGFLVLMLFSSSSLRELMVAATNLSASCSFSPRNWMRFLQRRSCCMVAAKAMSLLQVASASMRRELFLHSLRPRYSLMILSLPLPMIFLSEVISSRTSAMFFSILWLKWAKFSLLVNLFSKCLMSSSFSASMSALILRKQSLKMWPRKKLLKMSETMSLVKAMLDWKALEMRRLFSFWPRVTWKMRRLKTQSGLMRKGSSSMRRFLQLARKFTLLSGSSQYSQRLSSWQSLIMLDLRRCMTSSRGWKCCTQSSSCASRSLQMLSMLMEVQTCTLLTASQCSLTTFTFERQFLKMPSRKIRMFSLSLIARHSSSIFFCSTPSSSMRQVIWSRMRVKFRRIYSLFCITSRSWFIVSKNCSPNSLIFSVLMMFFFSSSSEMLISSRYRFSRSSSPSGLLNSFRLILSEMCRLREGSSSLMEQFLRRCSSTSFFRVYSVIIGLNQQLLRQAINSHRSGGRWFKAGGEKEEAGGVFLIGLLIIIMRGSLLLTVLAVLLLSASVLTTNPVCSLCHQIVKEFQHSVPRRPAESILSLIGTAYCSKKHLQNPNVCKGAVSEMIDSIINSLWRHFTDPHAVCHKLRFCPKEYQLRNLNDDIKAILKDKPNREWEQPTGRKTLRVAHISDLHPDLFYTVGAVEKCSEPVCCRSNSTQKLDPKEIWSRLEKGEALYADEERGENDGAGYWGSLSKCDLPIQTFNLFLKEIEEKDVDFIIWTGDNTPHDVWQQSQSYNLNFTTLLSEKFKKGFKGRVIAAMGNHQSFPVNVYDYQGTREQMLIGGLAEAWKDWLDQQAYDMLRTKGYFSISLPEFNNLKVISVNTQAQNNLNWFLLRNPTDPGDMLKWIESELRQSEKAGQFVYIIGHIPPKEALNDWSMRFNALVDRFSYTIRGQFYGHTHRDHVGLFPSLLNNSQLVNAYLIAPSLTTYSNKHPEYRVMSVDLDSLQVVDYEQYRLDLTKFKSKQDNARFELFYRFREAYGLKDMTIRGGMSEFREKMEKDNATQIKYSYFRSSGTEKGTAGRAVYCDTTTSPQFQAECSNSTFKPSAFEKAAGDWKDLLHA